MRPNGPGPTKSRTLPARSLPMRSLRPLSLSLAAAPGSTTRTLPPMLASNTPSLSPLLASNTPASSPLLASNTTASSPSPPRSRTTLPPPDFVLHTTPPPFPDPVLRTTTPQPDPSLELLVRRSPLQVTRSRPIQLLSRCISSRSTVMPWKSDVPPLDPDEPSLIGIRHPPQRCAPPAGVSRNRPAPSPHVIATLSHRCHLQARLDELPHVHLQETCCVF